MMDGFDISASGMRAQRLRMDLIANNMANVETTSARRERMTGPDGEEFVRHVPFRRQVALFLPRREDGGAGVSVPRVVDDPSAFRREHDPDHPHAIQAGPDRGMVEFPNINPIVEMVDMISASRAYEANLAALENFRSMSQASLRILG